MTSCIPTAATQTDCIILTSYHCTCTIKNSHTFYRHLHFIPPEDVDGSCACLHPECQVDDLVSFSSC